MTREDVISAVRNAEHIHHEASYRCSTTYDERDFAEPGCPLADLLEYLLPSDLPSCSQVLPDWELGVLG